MLKSRSFLQRPLEDALVIASCAYHIVVLGSKSHIGDVTGVSSADERLCSFFIAGIAEQFDLSEVIGSR